jgi:hypothetical protein
VPLGRHQVHHPPLGQQQQGPAVAELVGVHVRPHAGVHGLGQPVQRPDVDLHVEVARVGQDGAVAHHRQVVRVDDVDRAGDGDEHLAERRGLGHRQHPEPAQRGVQGSHRVDLGDDDLGAEAAGVLGHPAAAGPEPGHHHGLARQQGVGGAQDAVDGRLPGSAGVVHHALDRGVVGRDHREGERTLGGHPAQPDHARGGGLAAALDAWQPCGGPGVQRVDQVAAVVHDQVRRGVLERCLDMPVVALAVHPGPGEDRDAVVDGEGGRDVVLRGQRVGRRQGDGGAARPQQPDQVRGLGRDVQAGGDA